jgi:uncharacterized membrane protein YidH (DUF202 family)
LESWEKIVAAIILGGMVLFALPRVKQMLHKEQEQSREKSEPNNWRGFIFPMLLVVLFVVFLIMSVR